MQSEFGVFITIFLCIVAGGFLGFGLDEVYHSVISTKKDVEKHFSKYDKEDYHHFNYF